MDAFKLTADKHSRLHGLRGSADMFYLAELNRPAVAIVAHAHDMDVYAARYKTFRPEARTLKLPPLDGTPYSWTTIHAQIRRERALCFQALKRGEWDLLTVTAKSFLEPLPPPQKLAEPCLRLREGEEYDINELARTLAHMGYTAVDLVGQPGDFAKRGGILDFYSFTDQQAYRLDFFDEELEEIRVFDPATQRKTGTVDEVAALPLYEWLIGPEEHETFRRKGGELWNQTKARGHFLELVAQLKDRGRFPGYLHWTALFHDNPIHFCDLIGEDALFFVTEQESVNQAQEEYLAQLSLQNEAMANGNQAVAPLKTLAALDEPAQIPLKSGATALVHRQLKMNEVDFDFITQSTPQYKNDIARFLTHWRQQARRMAIAIVCRTRHTLDKLSEAIEEDGDPARHAAFPLPSSAPPGLYLAQGDLDTGFSWPERKLAVFSERDIWSQSRKTRQRKPASGRRAFAAEFRDLKIGDYVVHLDHGIGRFLGLVDMEAGGDTHEMMAIEYRDNQRLYLNLNQLDLVQRFSSSEGRATLDRMGGASWEKTKRRVKKAVRQMAGELLQLYAARALTKAHPCGPDTEWQRQFEDAFEHEPTTGQLTAIDDIKRGLESTLPMDRLLVGDVGFGKTEVAMRMAFKIAIEGLQTAVLCPTTVLAFQHYHTFKNRFGDFPIRIAWISRFSSPAHVKKTLQETADGQVDIIIGTHRLLSKDVQFKNLGAVIVDEEQRFGVAQKERLKTLRKQVHALSMSATPIPRTLNMALTGIRDISVIETPPRNRLAISTTVAESREGLIRGAIEFELNRDGQVFFIHNRVETMDAVAISVKGLVPRAKVATAHGQMDSRRIEKVMMDFMDRKIDVMVASTIIENGVDIPNANTMIVNRADMFGVSQLYQLRGRIGRSDRPAYAFLLAPPSARMSSLARKRLATLEEFSDLGSGFRIAAMDMELRGAGNLLGAEQAGQINAIGYDLYVKLVEEAIAELKGKPISDEIHCNVNLHFGAALPKRYIEETNQRLHYYKRLASAKSEQELAATRETLEDCYGPLPTEADLLCREHELRLFLAARKVLTADRERDRLKIRFHESAEVNADLALRWIQERRGIAISPDGVLTLPLPTRQPREAIAWLRGMIAELLD